MFSARVVLLSAGIVQMLICCAECKPQGSTLVLHDADCKDPPSPLYCLNANNTCRFCPEPSSGCPEGFFNPSGSSTQCFKYYGPPEHISRNWTQPGEFPCKPENLTIPTPNDDVVYEELSQYTLDIMDMCFKNLFQPQNIWRNWTEARDFCKEQNLTIATPNDDVNLGELSQYILDVGGVFVVWLGGRGSASGFLWEAGVGEQPGSSSGRRELDGHPGWLSGEPDSSDACLGMDPSSGSTPYFSMPCSATQFTLCQL